MVFTRQRFPILCRLLVLLTSTLLFVTLETACAKRKPTDTQKLNQELLQAASIGDTVTVSRLLAEGANIEAENQGEQTVLELAANNGQLDTVRFLLSKGASAVKGHVHSDEDLLDAAGQANANKVELLLELGIGTNATTEALFKAGESEPPVIVMSPEELKRLGIPRGKIEKAKYLKYEPGDYGNTVRLLLEHGAKIDGKDEEGATPLIRAAALGSNHVVQALLEHGAAVDARNKYGDTALIAAACECAIVDMPETLDSLKSLVSKGADVNASNKDGKTALMRAAAWGRKENLSFLLGKGAYIDAQDKNGDSALLIAAEGSGVPTSDATRLLLSRGASADLKNRDGETALMLAASKGGFDAIENVRLLLKGGADIGTTNNRGQTALDLAKKNHRNEIVAILRKSMAKSHPLEGERAP